MYFDIITLFPDFFRGPFDYGILHRALRTGKLTVNTHDLRTFTHDRHRTVDDRPFGGGEGMVLKPEPIFDCTDALQITPKPTRDLTRESVILLAAGGTRFTQSTARELAALERVVLLCGRYEGVDQRVPELLCDRELSVGDFVLSGGELPAALIIDAVARLLPGVLGHADSSRYESFGESDSGGLQSDSIAPDGSPRATHAAGGLLDYPHYTRPALFRDTAVPEVLQGGDHLAVRRWRRRAALERTLRFRPDLLESAELTREDHALLEELRMVHAARTQTDSKQ